MDDVDFFATVKYWLRMIRNYTSDSSRASKVIILGTHVDLSTPEQRRAVCAALEPELALNTNIIGYQPICAREEADIALVVAKLEQAITAAKLGAMQVPHVYLAVNAWIEQQRQLAPRLAWSEVRAAFPGVQERLLQQSLEFLHDMGNCLYNRKMQFLVLDPQWLAKTFRKVRGCSLFDT